MGLDVKETIEAFSVVEQALKNPEAKTHGYIRIFGKEPTCKSVTEKKRASSFKDITLFVVDVLSNPRIELEDKTKLVNSYTVLLTSFEKRNRLINYLFVLRLIKKKVQSRTAHQLIESFTTYVTTPTEDSQNSPFHFAKFNFKIKKENRKLLKLLKKEEIFLKKPMSYEECSQLPLGTYVVWENRKNKEYVFYQKTQTDKIPRRNFDKMKPQGSVCIKATQNLEKELLHLISQENAIEILKKQGYFCKDYLEAESELKNGKPYAFYYEKVHEEPVLHFLEHVPGIELKKEQAILLDQHDNPFEFLETVTSLEHQLKALAKAGVYIADVEKAIKKLAKPGHFFLTENHSSNFQVYFLNGNGQVQIKKLEETTNFFSEINLLVSEAKQLSQQLEELRRKGLLVEDGFAALKKLKPKAPGTFAFYRGADQYDLGFMIKVSSEPKFLTVPIKKDEDIFKKIISLTSPTFLLTILTEEGKLVNSPQKAVEVLNCQPSGSYILWWTPKRELQLLVKNSFSVPELSEAITLNPSLNLFEQIENSLSSYKTGYTEDLAEARQVLKGCSEIGDFVFFPYKIHENELYRFLIRVYHGRSFVLDVQPGELIQFLNSFPTSQGLWEYLCSVEYAFDHSKDAIQAFDKGLEREYLLCKNNSGKICFVPRFFGINPFYVPPIEMDTSKGLKEALNQPFSNEQMLEWFTQSGMKVNSEKKARKKLLNKPLGSIMIWTDSKHIYILQKKENQRQIDFAPYKISVNENLEQTVRNLYSKEHQTAWLNEHVKAMEGSLDNLPIGSYRIIKTGPNYRYVEKNPFTGKPVQTLIKPFDLWNQLDFLTSRARQWEMLVMAGLRVENEAEAKDSFKGKPLFWLLPNQDVGMYMGVVDEQTLEVKTINKIIPTDHNLFEIIGDWVKPHLEVENLQKMQEAKLVAKRTFLEEFNEKNPDLISFQTCVEIYRKAMLICHPDTTRLPEKEATESYKRYVEAKENFVEQLQIIVKQKLDFSKKTFKRLD